MRNITAKKAKIRCAVLSMLTCLFIIFIALIIVFSVKISYVPVRIDNLYEKSYETPSVKIETNSENFKVLKISDTHLINGKTKSDIKTLENIKSVLGKNKYDLIILNGDLVEGFNMNFSYNKYKAIDSFAAIVEEYEIIWTFVPGNNDREMQGDNKKMISYLMQFEHFIIGNSVAVDGDVNFVINIERDSEIAHTIILLDSHSRRFPVIGDYDYIKESKIDFVRKIAENHETYISIFFHMPTEMFEKAFYEGTLLSNFPQSAPYPFHQVKNSGLFDEGIATYSNISLISSSHIHSNNMLSFYNGRYYELNSASGFGAERNDNIKPTVTEININLSVSAIENLYDFISLK